MVDAHGTPQQVALRSRIVLARPKGALTAPLRVVTSEPPYCHSVATRFLQEGKESLWVRGQGPQADLWPEKIQAIVKATYRPSPKG